MATFKISVTELTEYPETITKYETENNERYTSSYNLDKDGVEYKTVQHETGRKLIREREVYAQDFTAEDLSEVIKAVNGIK